MVVLTSRPITFRQGPGIQLGASAESPVALLQRLALQGCRHACIDSGPVIQSCLYAFGSVQAT